MVTPITTGAAGASGSTWAPTTAKSRSATGKAPKGAAVARRVPLTPGDDLPAQLMPDEVEQPEKAIIGQDDAEPQQHVAQDPHQLQPVAPLLLLAQPQRGWGGADAP